MNKMPKMKIEVWSDTMCPFCYLGKNNYESALKVFEHSGDVELIWHSFQLNPDFPEQTPEKVNYYQYIADIKGLSSGQAEKLLKGIVDLAKIAGLKYNLDKAVMFNSMNVHRIIQKAKSKELADKAEERMFYAFFTEGKYLNDIATLENLGKEIGLTSEEVEDALSNELYAYLVKQDMQEAANRGIDTVPTFVFNEKYSVTGSQSSEVFLETLQKSYEEYSNL